MILHVDMDAFYAAIEQREAKRLFKRVDTSAKRRLADPRRRSGGGERACFRRRNEGLEVVPIELRCHSNHSILNDNNTQRAISIMNAN